MSDMHPLRRSHAAPAEVIAPGEPTLREVVESIRSNLNSASFMFGKGMDYIINAGDGLIKLKGMVKHGLWIDILDELGLNRRTAARFMQLARRRPELLQYVGGSETRLSQMTQRQAMRLLTDDRKKKR
jgi:hypothetical protein